MKRILTILLCYCMFSCMEDTKKYARYFAFPEEKALVAETIPLDTVLFRYPFRVKVMDSVAIVLDLHNMNHFMHAFSYPEWKHIVSFGKRGEGPEEMLSAENFRFQSLDSLWVLDANRMQLTRWRISEAERLAERVEEINLDKSLVRALDFFETDAGFIVPDYLGDCRYHQISRQAKLLTSEGEIPTEKNNHEASRVSLAQAWRSFMDYNPGAGVWALATQLGEVLEIYNLKDTTYTVLYGPHGEPEFQVSQGEGIPTGIMGFSDIQITDQYIYAVFHGRTFKDIQLTYQQDGKHEDGGRSIYVFDLKGNPVCIYKLDHAIYSISVREDIKTIFATDVNSDEPIIKFRI